jgi:hypothetical protein
MTALETRASNMRRERMLALFDDLQQSGELTPELLQSDDFLHCFVAAATAAQRTARREVSCVNLASANHSGRCRAVPSSVGGWPSGRRRRS